MISILFNIQSNKFGQKKKKKKYKIQGTGGLKSKNLNLKVLTVVSYVLIHF